MIHKKLNLRNRWVYLKGHLDGRTIVDLIYNGIDLHEIKSDINTKILMVLDVLYLLHLHRFMQIIKFFEVAKTNDYVNIIKSSDLLNVGSGHGPLNHFHRFN